MLMTEEAWICHQKAWANPCEAAGDRQDAGRAGGRHCAPAGRQQRPLQVPFCEPGLQGARGKAGFVRHRYLQAGGRTVPLAGRSSLRGRAKGQGPCTSTAPAAVLGCAQPPLLQATRVLHLPLSKLFHLGSDSVVNKSVSHYLS